MAEKVRSEDILGQKWDRCVSNTAIKTVSGLGLGIVFSFIFFKRRIWPVALSTGIGIGMAYATCQHDFQSPFFIQGKNVPVTEATDKES